MVSSRVKHIKICITSVYLSLLVICLGEPMAASQNPNCFNTSSAFGEKLFATEVSGPFRSAGKRLPQPLLNQKLNGEERLQFQVNLGILIHSWNELCIMPRLWKTEKSKDWLRLISFNLYLKNSFHSGFLRGNKTPTYVTSLRRTSTLPIRGINSKCAMWTRCQGRGWQDIYIGYHFIQTSP